MSTLKKNIEAFVTFKGISVRELERRAGLKARAIYNILAGKSESPSISTLLPIAKEMGCSLDQLVLKQPFLSEINISIDNDIKFVKRLYDKTYKFILDNINQEKVSFGLFMNLLSEIFIYSTVNNNGTLDEEYALWFIKRKLK